MGASNGLCVLNAHAVVMDDRLSNLMAEVWRMGLSRPDTELKDASLLRFYWQTGSCDCDRCRMYGNWVAVRENPGYESDEFTRQWS